jgi:hypothetical protein
MDATHTDGAPNGDVVLQARGLRKEFGALSPSVVSTSTFGGAQFTL